MGMFQICQVFFAFIVLILENIFYFLLIYFLLHIKFMTLGARHKRRPWSYGGHPADESNRLSRVWRTAPPERVRLCKR